MNASRVERLFTVVPGLVSRAGMVAYVGVLLSVAPLAAAERTRLVNEQAFRHLEARITIGTFDQHDPYLPSLVASRQAKD